MQTRGRGPKNPKILRPSYLEVPYGRRGCRLLLCYSLFLTYCPAASSRALLSHRPRPFPNTLCGQRGIAGAQHGADGGERSEGGQLFSSSKSVAFTTQTNVI